MIVLALAACGDEGEGEGAGDANSAALAPSTASVPTPAWMDVDPGERIVTIDLTAGLTATNDLWNFNGYARGAATLIVPEGFTVTINFKNMDPANTHSVAVMPASDGYDATFHAPQPVFLGAISAAATSVTDAQSADDEPQSFSFRASRAGHYALVCLVPAHALTGMWVGFEVSSSGEAGLRT